jgi:glycosyl hydrolase family 42 (putative beta-galactosidase)
MGKSVLSGAAVLALWAASAGAAPGSSWTGFRAIVWQPQKPGSCAALKELDIDAGAVIPEDREQPAKGFEQRTAPLRECGLSWYVENIATDFYSSYHRYTPGKPVNWRFIEVKKAYRDNPRDPAVFMREPGLSDPAWRKRISERLAETVHVHRAHRPLFYDLGDETGIADLSAFWDFDFSPHSLAGMRLWLKGRYRDLDALNAQWGSRFPAWDAVTPMTTAEAMKRADGNWSAWADFKDWMDEEFARALKLGADAIHAADPRALAAIAGAQVPGWGGYDYSRLAGVVDVMELNDGGGNVEIARALNPKLVLLTTSHDRGAREALQLWRTLLRGGRGIVFWDPKGEIVGGDGRPGERGRAVSPYLREIKSVAPLLIRSRRQTAPVAVLYSPASMRTQWMLDWQPKRNAWSDRRPGQVYEDASAVRTSMAGFLALLNRAALEPRILTPALVEKGALRRGIRALILPRAIALSDLEAAEIRRFAAAGGTVIADGAPGAFDEHSRRRAEPPLAPAVHMDYTEGDKVIAHLVQAGVIPAFTLTRKDGSRTVNIETHVWRDGETTIVGLQRDPGDATPEPVVLTLREPRRIRDLRARKALGTAKSIELTVDPVAPTLLSISKG